MSNFPPFNQSFEDGAYLASFSSLLDTYQVWIPSGWLADYLSYYNTTNRDRMESGLITSWKTDRQYAFKMKFNSGTTWRGGDDQIVFRFPNLEVPADACWIQIDYNIINASSNFTLNIGVKDSIFTVNGNGVKTCSSTGTGTLTASSATFKDTNAAFGFLLALICENDTTNVCTVYVDNIRTTNAVADNTSTRLEVGSAFVNTSIDTTVSASNFNATAETVTLTVDTPWDTTEVFTDVGGTGTKTMSKTFASGNKMWYTFDYQVSEFNGDVWCDVDDHDAWVETKVHYLSPSGNDANSGLTKYDAYRTFDFLANNIADGESAIINFGGYNDEPTTSPDVFPLNIGTTGITYTFLDFFSEGMDQKAYVGAPAKFLRDHAYSTFGQYYVTYIAGERLCVGMDTTYNDIVTTTWDTFASDKGVDVLVDSAPEDMSVYAGASVILEDGYSLKIVEINEGTPNTARLQLWDGAVMVDEDLSVDEYGRYTYVDTGHPSGEDIPIVSVQLGEFFFGTETTVLWIVGIWQCSDYVTTW